MLKETIATGAALAKFAEFVEAQGGDQRYIFGDMQFEQADMIEPVYAEQNGYLTACQTSEVGMASLILGGGRETKDSVIDFRVGIRLVRHLGDEVTTSEPFAYLYGNDTARIAEAKKRLLGAYTISAERVEPQSIVKGIIR
jgi:pyrimidine-nucleoside phosphorylase